MAMSQAFKDIANDPNGEGLVARVKLRVDTTVGDDQLVTVTDSVGLLAVSPITRQRERKWGIVQAQQWLFRLSHDVSLFNPNSSDFITNASTVVGKWAWLEVGFETANEWAVIAGGVMKRVQVATDLSVVITVHDPLMDGLRKLLKRDVSFQETLAWWSEVQDRGKASTSGSYNSATNPITTLGGFDSLVGDETYEIEFTSGTNFKVNYEDGTSTTGFSTAANADFFQVAQKVIAIGRIYSAGWTGSFSTGDKFVFYSSKPRTSNVNPMKLLDELLSGGTDFCALKTRSLSTGALGNVWLSTSKVSTEISSWSSVKCNGVWRIGTPIIEMIQGLLRIMGMTVYPTDDGHIDFWVLRPGELTTTGPPVTGDADDPLNSASVIRVVRVDADDDLATQVVTRYKQLADGADASDQFDDDTAQTEFGVIQKEIDVGNWRVTPGQMESVGNQYLNRFKNPIATYTIFGSLTNLLEYDIAWLIDLTEPWLDELNTRLQIVQKTLDVFNNTVTVVAWDDPIVSQDYFIIGTSLIDDTNDLLW